MLRNYDNSPKITIVIACLNAEDSIAKCLESIVIQNYSNIEVVVVDGDSIDGTSAILRQYALRLAGRFSWISEPDSGIADAWNKAIKQATGEWILFLGADDTLSAPDVLSRISPRLAGAFPRHAAVYGIVAVTDPDGRLIEHLDRPWSPEKFRNCIENLPHSALFHHHSLFDRHGLFDPSFKLTLDYDFLLRELMHTAPLRIDDLVVTNAQVGGISSNYRNRLKAVAERIRVCHRHMGTIPPIMYWWIAKVWGSWLLYQLGGTPLVTWATNLFRSLAGARPPQRS